MNALHPRTPFIGQSWRWFGPRDLCTLQHIRHAGATSVVTALHEVPCGEVWTVEAIRRRQEILREAGLSWSVVESVPIHEDIKLARPGAEKYIRNYITSLENLAACGQKVVCYNFMALTDWTRTVLDAKWDDGSESSRYDAVDAAAFDLFILKRPEATKDIPARIQKVAAERFASMDQAAKDALSKVILMGLPGTVDDLSLEDFRAGLRTYADLGTEGLRQRLFGFLRQIIPVAEKHGILMAIHPDDPPFPIFGLPRVVSTEADLKALVEAVDSPSNGITFCTGSLGGNKANDLPGIVRRLGHRIHFIHLRNVRRDEFDGFAEVLHLDSTPLSVDMPAVMGALVDELSRRAALGNVTEVPMRPDHGLRMVDDLSKTGFYPGYSTIGRLRGLAELRGLEQGIRFARGQQG